MQPSERNPQLNLERYDVWSIPNFVMKKNPSRGARHGRTEDSESVTMPTICQEDSYRIHSEIGWKCKTLATMNSSSSLSWWRPSDSWWPDDCARHVSASPAVELTGHELRSQVFVAWLFVNRELQNPPLSITNPSTGVLDVAVAAETRSPLRILQRVQRPRISGTIVAVCSCSCHELV